MWASTVLLIIHHQRGKKSDNKWPNRNLINYQWRWMVISMPRLSRSWDILHPDRSEAAARPGRAIISLDQSLKNLFVTLLFDVFLSDALSMHTDRESTGRANTGGWSVMTYHGPHYPVNTWPWHVIIPVQYYLTQTSWWPGHCVNT